MTHDWSTDPWDAEGDDKAATPEQRQPATAAGPSERFRGLVGQDRDQPLADAIREFADSCDRMHPGKFQGWTEVWRGWAERIEAKAAAPVALDEPDGVMESCTRWHRGGTEHFHYHPIEKLGRGEGQPIEP